MGRQRRCCPCVRQTLRAALYLKHSLSSRGAGALLFSVRHPVVPPAASSGVPGRRKSFAGKRARIKNMAVQSNTWPPSGKQVRNGTSHWIPPFTRKAPSLLLADETAGLASMTETCPHQADTVSPAQASDSIHQSSLPQNSRRNKHRTRRQHHTQTQPHRTANMDTATCTSRRRNSSLLAQLSEEFK